MLRYANETTGAMLICAVHGVITLKLVSYAAALWSKHYCNPFVAISERLIKLYKFFSHHNNVCC